MADDSDRIFPATPQQLERARREGQVAKSADLAGPLALLAGGAVLAWAGPAMIESLRAMVSRSLTAAGQVGGADGAAVSGAGVLGVQGWQGPALFGLAVCAAAAAGTAIAHLVQVGWMWNAGLAGANWRRVSPLASLERLMSLRTLMTLAMTALKVLAVGLLLWRQLPAVMDQLAHARGAADWAAAAGGSAVRLGLWLVGLLGVLAVLDWLYQRWQWRQDLRMTRQQWLDDMRRTARASTVRRQQEAN